MDNYGKVWWPKTTGMAVWTFAPYWRANKGVGSYAAFSGSPLNIPPWAIIRTGYSQGAPVSEYLDMILTYFLNKGIHLWYSPVTGTPQEAIAKALASVVLPVGTASVTMNLYFDGQFGSVYVG